MRVSGAGYEGAAQGFKLSHPVFDILISSYSNISAILSVSCSAQDSFPEPVIEGNDLCGADKGEVEGVEEEHHIFARIVGEADLH